MQGSPSVIAALNEVFANWLALEQQAHLQEHKFEAMRYAFSDWFHVIEEEGHEQCIHKLLNRINALGGTPSPRYAFPPASPVEGIAKALSGIVTALQTVHQAYNKACELAEKDDDYVTEKKIWKQLAWLEGQMTKFEARSAQCEKVGEKAFMAEYL